MGILPEVIENLPEVIENIVGKGEGAGNRILTFFLQCFSKVVSRSIGKIRNSGKG